MPEIPTPKTNVSLTSEEALQLFKEADFARTILESSSDCIEVLDLGGHLLLMNNVGRTQIEIDDFVLCLGKPWTDFWEGESRDKAAAALEEARAGRKCNFEGFCPTLAGVPKWWEVIITPIRRADGKIKELLAISRDITDRKQIQDRLQVALGVAEEAQAFAEAATAKANEARVVADSANLVKSEFLANMSHEIRTPMGAVIGLANILALSRPLTERQTEYVSTLRVSATSLLTLINDLLDISKIESRSVDLENVPFSLHKVMGEVISMMSMRANEKKLAFTVDDQSAPGARFMGDPMRLRQVLLNLCGNAIKFTERGSVRVTISTQAIEDARFEVAIAVADTGIGIAAGKLASVFDRFVQADTSMSRRYGGTGLGLTISKTLVELMEGAIAVESVAGKGSVFTIRVPFRLVPDNHPERPAGEEEGPAVISQARVLLVEDHEPNILVESTYLEMMGIACDVARDGLQAMEKFAQRKYDLLLLDVQMPSMDGLEVTRRIRAQEKANGLLRTPIIGMTAYALAGDRQRCLDVGMDEYISKPFDPEDLKTKVLAFIDLREAAAR
jgi:PAS domain S-box-containing protein